MCRVSIESLVITAAFGLLIRVQVLASNNNNNNNNSNSYNNIWLIYRQIHVIVLGRCIKIHLFRENASEFLK